MQGKSSKACGKIVLSGEHSVIYGYKALALAIPQLELKLSFIPDGYVSSWNEALIIPHYGNVYKEKLIRAILKTIELMNCDNLRPQKIKFETNIPLGAGLGGSAAFCLAIVRLFKNCKNISEVFIANETEKIFHGNTSGLDVAAIASNGAIAFSKESGSKILRNNSGFKIMLIDTHERSQTSNMIKKVSENLNKNTIILSEINKITEKSIAFFEEDNLPELGHLINKNHELLQELGVSNDKLNQAVERLHDLGALGAKLTGSGGGGFAFGLFNKNCNIPETENSILLEYSS